MKSWADLAIEKALARGATYADVRVMDIRHRDISTKNGEVGTLAEGESLGIGIRVIADGAWGFASTDRLTARGRRSLRRRSRRHRQSLGARQAPRCRAGARSTPTSTPGKIRSSKIRFCIPVERQIDLLLAADKEMRRVKGVTLRGRFHVLPPHRTAFRLQHRLR